MPKPEPGNTTPGEYERRATELDRFRMDTLRAPERFADTMANDEETLRLGHGKDLVQVGPKRVTVMLRGSRPVAPAGAIRRLPPSSTTPYGSRNRAHASGRSSEPSRGKPTGAISSRPGPSGPTRSASS